MSKIDHVGDTTLKDTSETGIDKTTTEDGRTIFSVEIPELAKEAAFDYLNTVRPKIHEVTVTVSGAAGSGKSFVGNRIIEALKAAGFGVETVVVKEVQTRRGT